MRFACSAENIINPWQLPLITIFYIINDVERRQRRLLIGWAGQIKDYPVDNSWYAWLIYSSSILREPSFTLIFPNNCVYKGDDHSSSDSNLSSRLLNHCQVCEYRLCVVNVLWQDDPLSVSKLVIPIPTVRSTGTTLVHTYPTIPVTRPRTTVRSKLR